MGFVAFLAFRKKYSLTYEPNQSAMQISDNVHEMAQFHLQDTQMYN